MTPHYWISEPPISTDDGRADVISHRCRNCGMESHLFLEYLHNHFSLWYEFRYPNGDMSLVFDTSLPNPCPVDWDFGSWLPGAIEI